MKYEIKPKHKFPYILHIDESRETYYNVINPWIRENIGRYNKKWRCPRLDDSDSYYPYAFKDEEDAMAFKLWWEE